MRGSTVPVTLFAFMALVTLAWGAGLLVDPGPMAASLPWRIYDQALYLSGLLAIALMSLTMLLATRPAWLEAPLGGLDRLYLTHKWAGILAVAFAATHWLVEMGDDLIKSAFGRQGRLSEPHLSGLMDLLRDAAEDVGEWGIYLALALLLLTLWRAFPYKAWRYLHRAMPALYLLLAFHTLWLAPTHWWTQPPGLLLAVLLSAGSLASVLSLTGRIGRRRRVRGRIAAVSEIAPGVTEVVCRLDGWPGHRPGQFALVTFDRLEGAHPFTIASADQGDGQVRFQIKALGDYTRHLASKLSGGQAVTVEGPYGCFDFQRATPGARQIWVAGGIGVTPFLAWLEALSADPAQAPHATLHYCTRDAASDPTAARLRELCATLPSIELRLHDSARGERLTAEQLLPDAPAKPGTDLWFCGPSGLADALRRGLRQAAQGPLRFHQEAFRLR